MPTFNEFFSPKRVITTFGAKGFMMGTFNEELRTPHWEMQRVIEMIMTRPIVITGLRQIAHFIIGEKISFESFDKKSADFLNDWIAKRTNIKNEIFNFIILRRALGNAYLEPTYRQGPNNIMVLDNIYNVADPSRVYINQNAQSEDDFYIYQLPTEARFWKTRYGDELAPKFWDINYVKGSQVQRLRIWGVGVHKRKLWWSKYGWSPDGIYGRSDLASAIDDSEIIEKIVRNYGIIARQRAIGKKLIKFGDKSDAVSPKDMDDLTLQLNNLTDEEHIITNKSFQVESLHFTGENDDMTQPLDFLRKELGSALVPNFLTPFNSEVNRSTADQAKIPFMMDIESQRQEIEDYLTHHIINSLRIAYPWLDKNAKLKFGSISLEGRDEKMQYAQVLYNVNGLTLNELRKAAGYDPIRGGDIFAKDNVKPFIDHNNPFNPINVQSADIHNTFIEQFTDEEFDKETGKKYKTIIKKGIGGKVFRLAHEKKAGTYHVFEGAKEVDVFKKDEKNVAMASFDRAIERAKEDQQEFFDANQSEENQEIDKLFDLIKREIAVAIDEVFTLIKNNSIKEQPLLKEKVLDQNALTHVDDIFMRLNQKLSTIIQSTFESLMGFVIEKDHVETPLQLRTPLQQIGDSLFRSKTLGMLKKFSDDAKEDVKRTLSTGIAAGMDVRDIKKQLKDKYSNYKHKNNPQDSDIEKIVRTELNSNLNLLRLRKWHEMGFTYFEWLTSQDENVRESHRRRNRKIFKIEDALQGKIIFPGGSLSNNAVDAPNINCRCAALLVLNK